MRLHLPGLRWWIIALLFLAAVLNYLDRQVLALLAPSIQKDLGLTDIDYGNVTSGFLVAYTISLIAMGRLVDRLGVRLSLALSVGWWSLANMAHAFARSVPGLAACQVFLGLGEAGNWPNSAKAVSEWFPAKERAIAIGLYTMGATVGATLAPILILHLAGGGAQWQNAFLWTGLAGLVWILPWWFLYRRPQEHPAITPAELALVPAAVAPVVEGSELSRWQAVLSLKAVWLLLAARMLTDPVWYFYQFWFAKYLVHDRAVAQAEVGQSWVVFLAADAGCLLGGFLSAWFIKRGNPAPSARLRAMICCAVLPPLSFLIPAMPSTGWTLVVAMAVVFAHLMWLANLGALLVDVIPPRLVATAFGVVAAGSALGGIMMNQTVSRLVTGHSYTLWFLIAAVLHPVAWLILAGGRIHREKT